MKHSPIEDGFSGCAGVWGNGWYGGVLVLKTVTSAVALSDSRVAMATTCKGIPMGSTVTISKDEVMRVSLQASCAHTIKRALLIRDGEPLAWTEINAKTTARDLVDVGHGGGRESL